MSSAWRATPPSASCSFDALVNQPLVRGVLVDDHHRIAGLRDDVGLVQLRSRAPRAGDREDRAPRRRRRRSASPLGALTPASGACIKRNEFPGRARALRRPATRGRPASSRGRSRVLACAPAPRSSPCPASEARCPAASNPRRSAPTIRPRTPLTSRKRTSALVGCTLTSTSRGGSVTNSASSGIASARDQVGVGSPHGPNQQSVPDRPTVDEQILLASYRAG